MPNTTKYADIVFRDIRNGLDRQTEAQSRVQNGLPPSLLGFNPGGLAAVFRVRIGSHSVFGDTIASQAMSSIPYSSSRS